MNICSQHKNEHYYLKPLSIDVPKAHYLNALGSIGGEIFVVNLEACLRRGHSLDDAGRKR